MPAHRVLFLFFLYGIHTEHLTLPPYRHEIYVCFVCYYYIFILTRREFLRKEKKVGNIEEDEHFVYFALVVFILYTYTPLLLFLFYAAQNISVYVAFILIIHKRKKTQTKLDALFKHSWYKIGNIRCQHGWFDSQKSWSSTLLNLLTQKKYQFSFVEHILLKMF